MFTSKVESVSARQISPQKQFSPKSPGFFESLPWPHNHQFVLHRSREPHDESNYLISRSQEKPLHPDKERLPQLSPSPSQKIISRRQNSTLKSVNRAEFTSNHHAGLHELSQQKHNVETNDNLAAPPQRIVKKYEAVLGPPLNRIFSSLVIQTPKASNKRENEKSLTTRRFEAPERHRGMHTDRIDNQTESLDHYNSYYNRGDRDEIISAKDRLVRLNLTNVKALQGLDESLDSIDLGARSTSRRNAEMGSQHSPHISSPFRTEDRKNDYILVDSEGDGDQVVEDVQRNRDGKKDVRSFKFHTLKPRLERIVINKSMHSPGRHFTTNYYLKKSNSTKFTDSSHLSTTRMDSMTNSLSKREYSFHEPSQLKLNVMKDFEQRFSPKRFPRQANIQEEGNNGTDSKEMDFFNFDTNRESRFLGSNDRIFPTIDSNTPKNISSRNPIQKFFPSAEEIKKEELSIPASLQKRRTLQNKRLSKRFSNFQAIEKLTHPSLSKRRTKLFVRVGSKLDEEKDALEANLEKEEGNLPEINPPSNPIFHKKLATDDEIKRGVAHVNRFNEKFQRVADFKKLRKKLREALNFLKKLKINPKQVRFTKIESNYN